MFISPLKTKINGDCFSDVAEDPHSVIVQRAIGGLRAKIGPPAVTSGLWPHYFNSSQKTDIITAGAERDLSHDGYSY